MLTSTTNVTPVHLSDLTELFSDATEFFEVFYLGELAEDIDSDREEYVTSHTDLIKTLNPMIVGLMYKKVEEKELAIIRFENHILPVNITRMSDEEVTRTLMDYAWES